MGDRQVTTDWLGVTLSVCLSTLHQPGRTLALPAGLLYLAELDKVGCE